MDSFDWLKHVLPGSAVCTLIFALILPYPYHLKDCGEHTHQYQLRFRGLSLVVECPLCGQRWQIREQHNGYMALVYLGAFLFLRLGMNALEDNGMIPAAWRFWIFAAALLITLLVLSGFYYLRLRRIEPAKLAGTEIEPN